MVYLFSPYTKVQALICSGNYYYSPQQVYALADLSVDSRTFSHPAGEVEKTLESNPLIESAQVIKDGQNLSIAIQEKTIIGYYEQDGANYLVTSANERIPVENETELRTLVHFPLLVDLPDETIEKIAKETTEHPDQLTRTVYEKIAEILPWQESYDKNMLKLVLQDGNTVFTSIPSLFMMSTYQQVLSNLQGENVCLLLDGDNGVVNKVACDYMYLSPEQRAENREIPKSILSRSMLPEGSDEAEKKALEKKRQEEEAASAAQNPQPESPESPQPALETPAASVENPQPPADLQSIADWEASAAPGIQYSPSTGLFHEPETGIYYTYNAADDTFYPYVQQ